MQILLSNYTAKWNWVENSSNIFLIIINENLYFKIWSPFQPPLHLRRLYYIDAWKSQYMYWYMYSCLFLKQTSNALRGTIIYCISEIWVLYIYIYIIKIHSQRFILHCNVSRIYKHKGKQQS